MPTEIEKFESRAVSVDKNGKTSMERIYHVGVHDPADALEYGPAINERFEDRRLYCVSKSAQPLSLNWCVLTAKYESPDQSSIGTSKNKTVWNHDISGESEHIVAVDKESYQTHYSVKSGAAATDDPNVVLEVGTSIGKQPDGKVDGTDVIFPRVTMSCEVNKNPSEVKDSYKATVYGMVGKVNAAAFKGWDAHEVLFTGCQITEVSGELTRLSFKFLCSKNKTGLRIWCLSDSGPTRVQVQADKEGWQYLWKRIGTRNHRLNATSAPTLQEGTLSVHVATVYEEGDFSLLGIAGLPRLFVSNPLF